MISYFFFCLFLRKWSQIIMKFNHMMNGEVASCQVGRKLYTHVKVRSSWVSLVLSISNSMLANWIEFLTASVSTKHEGARRVLVKFENMASNLRFTLCTQVILSHMYWIWELFVQTTSDSFKIIHQNDFSGDFGGGSWCAVWVPQGHWIFSRWSPG